MDEQEVQKVVHSLLEDLGEAESVVHSLGTPHLTETPVDLHERLLVTRSALSRSSELVAKLIRLKGMCAKDVLRAAGELEDSEASAVGDRVRPSFTEDYSSAKERNARLAAQTVEQRINLRRARLNQAEVDSAVEYGRNRLWELDRAVRDIDTRLRILVFEPGVQ